jgi:hypothetical protein
VITSDERKVTITALAKTQHLCISNERTTEFSVSVGRLPKQLGDLSHIAFSRHTKQKIHHEVESQLEALE